MIYGGITAENYTFNNSGITENDSIGCYFNDYVSNYSVIALAFK